MNRRHDPFVSAHRPALLARSVRSTGRRARSIGGSVDATEVRRGEAGHVPRLVLQTGTWIIAIFAVTYACSMPRRRPPTAVPRPASSSEAQRRRASRWPSWRFRRRRCHPVDGRDAGGGRHLGALGHQRRGERLVGRGCRAMLAPWSPAISWPALTSGGNADQSGRHGWLSPSDGGRGGVDGLDRGVGGAAGADRASEQFPHGDVLGENARRRGAAGDRAPQPPAPTRRPRPGG